MKDFNEIAIFSRVAQFGSFSKASKDLEIPVSTVSRKVSDLEKRLGITLIQRTTRKLSLTSAGLRYYEQCAELFRGLEDAETQVTQLQTQPEGRLRVSIPVGLSGEEFMRFIAKLLSRFSRLQIDLVITNEFVDRVEENVDVAIRFGELNDSSLIARRLGNSASAVVAAPSYLKKNGIPKHPQDLKKHECVVYGLGSEESVWELSKEKSRQRVKVGGRVIASDMAALKNLAVAAQGIALLPQMYVTDEIRSGKLQILLPGWLPHVESVHVVYSYRRFMPARMSVFLNELESWSTPLWVR